MLSDVAVAIQQHDQMRPRVEIRADLYQAVFSLEGYVLEEALAQALVESEAQTVTQAPVVLRLPHARPISEGQHQDRANMPLLDAVDDLLSDLTEKTGIFCRLTWHPVWTRSFTANQDDESSCLC